MPSEYVFLLNNGPEPDTALYDGTNNGLGLTEHTAQVMRFDVQPMPADQTLRPFTAEQQYQLNTAMLAQWAASVPPLANATAPVKRIALLSQKTADGNPVAVSLGTVEGTAAKPLLWTDAVRVALGGCCGVHRHTCSGCASVWSLASCVPHRTLNSSTGRQPASQPSPRHAHQHAHQTIITALQPTRCPSCMRPLFVACTATLYVNQVAAKAAPSDTQFYDVINLSDEAHPIHLQGLNFRVRAHA